MLTAGIGEVSPRDTILIERHDNGMVREKAMAALPASGALFSKIVVIAPGRRVLVR